MKKTFEENWSNFYLFFMLTDFDSVQPTVPYGTTLYVKPAPIQIFLYILTTGWGVDENKPTNKEDIFFL